MLEVAIAEPKERPILFSSPMVLALLAGTKTQTRRAWRNQPPPGVPVGWVPGETKQPYGWPGDRLWVRESARCDYRGETPPDGSGAIGVSYRAGGSRMQDYRLDQRDDFPWFPGFSHNRDGSMRWAPGIHMPRWASRILLEVTDVRVQRLRQISDADAIAEGIEALEHNHEWRNYINPIEFCITPRGSYLTLWDSIHGAGSSDLNPWVWCAAFKRVKP